MLGLGTQSATPFPYGAFALLFHLLECPYRCTGNERETAQEKKKRGRLLILPRSFLNSSEGGDALTFPVLLWLALGRPHPHLEGVGQLLAHPAEQSAAALEEQGV